MALNCILFCHCNSSHHKEPKSLTTKFTATEPFASSMVASEFFEINTAKDNVVASSKGMHIAIPENCFHDAKGKTATGNVKIELAEAPDLSSMILSNLTTTSNGKPLITDGMFYFNATTSGGEQLFIDENNPVYVEIPAANREEGMMIYQGERDTDGNMNWVDPKKPENFLIPIDLDQLDFYPEGFEEEVDAGLPFANHAIATPILIDSLYNSMQTFHLTDFSEQERLLKINEAYYEQQESKDSNALLRENSGRDTLPSSSSNAADSSSKPCGIEPARISVLKKPAFQNTIISTREFETRLKTIFKTCDASVLDLYVDNPDKNLWEIDEMAAAKTASTPYAAAFKRFADEKLTTIKHEKPFQSLSNYYHDELQKLKNTLNDLQARADKQLKKNNKLTEQIVAEYKEVLTKRESVRMVTYGFTMTKTGWVNIDTGTVPKWWGPEPLNVALQNNFRFDHVSSYLIFPGIKSLYRLNSDDGKNFYAGNSTDKEMLMPKNSSAVVISIGFRNAAKFISVQPFITGVDVDLKTELKEANDSSIREAIQPYEFSRENSIATDLQFQTKLYAAQKRIDKMKAEQDFLYRLYQIVYPCCSSPADGEYLFKMYCTQCHSISHKLVGPALEGSATRHSFNWFLQWTRDSHSLIDAGDPDANAIWNEYGKLEQPHFLSLTVPQVRAIYKYIDSAATVAK